MKTRTKQTLLLVFRLALYLLAWETLITNIVNIFMPSLKIIRGSYYEEIVRQFDNTTEQYSDYLYVIKHNYTLRNCTEPIGLVQSHNYNYEFLKLPISLVFFWIGHLIMIVTSSTDMFFFIQEYRKPAKDTSQLITAEEKDCCMKCKSCCSKVASALMQIARIVFVSTTYALPAYYIANFDYSTPCLTPHPNLFLGDTGLIFYYINLTIMAVISMILLRRQIQTGIPETVFHIKGLRTGIAKASEGGSICALLTCNWKAIFRAALLQIVIIIVAVGLIGSMVIFFTRLVNKTEAFLTAINGALRMGFSFVILILRSIALIRLKQ